MTETKHKEFYTCKRLRMLEYLKNKGFAPCATIPDPTNDRYNWWLFKNTAELESCVEQYFAELQSRPR